MKKIILSTFIAGILLTFGPAFAQEKKEAKKDTKATTTAPAAQQAKPAMGAAAMTPEKRAEQAVNRISDKVKDLSPEQKKKLTDIHVASFIQADKDRDLAKTDMEKFKEVSKARVLKMRDDIKKEMTEAQWKTYTTPTPRPEGAPAGDKKDAPKPAAPKQEVKK